MPNNSTNREPFATEVPSLLKNHLEHLRASAISVDVIRERGYESVLGKKRLAALGFSRAQQRTPGILIPLHAPDGSPAGYQYRPDRPRLNAKGKPVKYENLAGSSIRLDVPPSCQKDVGNPHISIWFTEGVKKDDSLASAGVCSVGLNGVWGFKGGNPLGGTTTSADFDYIALAGRSSYIVYDSDYKNNPSVWQAADRLREHLARKGAEVTVIYLPPGHQGEKVGVDDYLAQGHTIDDLKKLASVEPPSQPPIKARQTYTIEGERICWLKHTSSGPSSVPLCNFDARVTEDIIKDNGVEQQRLFTVEGALATGKKLRTVQIPASTFNGMSWVSDHWGVAAILAAGLTLKDRLREAIQLQSSEAAQRLVYAHTGWREVAGKRGFLTAGGALELPEVEIELDAPLRRYKLPLETAFDISKASEASLEFLDIGEAKVTVPLWAAMYLAPLAEAINPAFTLWLVGPTGAFKSTIQALALCHFGAFTVRSLPASWKDTANYLEKLTSLAKDVPLVIDDWAPAADTRQAREYEIKAEQVARAQGNRLGRGRLRSDTSTRAAYIPRGVLITNGEQLPSGQSHTARLFSCEIEPADIDLNKLTAAQEQAELYPAAMAAYIRWLAQRWDEIEEKLPSSWEDWRRQAQTQGQHPRVPEAVAWLYSGVDMALGFFEDTGVITHTRAQEQRDRAWDILIELGNAQGGRVEEERPGRRFLEGLKALMDEGRVVFSHKDEEPGKASLLETQVGWRGEDDVLYLNPRPCYSVVYDFWRRSGEPLTLKANAVWKDLRRMGLTICEDGRTQGNAWIWDKTRRVVKLKMKALDDVQEV